MTVYDVVLDLHYTLISPVAGPQPGSLDVIYEPLRQEYFRQADHLPEFLRVLSLVDGVRVSVWSGSSRESAVNTARAIQVRDGVTLFDLANGRVFSRDDMDLHADKTDSTVRGRYKRLSRVLPGFNPDRATLLDDQRKNAAPGEGLNLLWMQLTYNFIEDFDAWKIGPGRVPGRYDPLSWSTWFLERNKLAWALGLIQTAVDGATAGGGSVSKILWNLQHGSDGGLLARDSRAQFKYFERGWELMKVKVPLKDRCRLDLSELEGAPFGHTG